MSSVLGEQAAVKCCTMSAILSRFLRVVQAHMEQGITHELGARVDRSLGRLSHVRRQRLAPTVLAAVRCPRCGSRQSRRFSRNGSRPRTLLTVVGILHVWLPRLICQCGGSVPLDFSPLLRPYQRLSTEVEAHIQRWAGLCLSLRQMQREGEQTFIGSLGLSTLLKRVHQLEQLGPARVGDAHPPVVQVDAIWMTQLRPNGRWRRDAKGRRRPVKGRFKRPLFIAFGVWAETGAAQVLAWRLAESESAAEWLVFLSALEEAGLRAENGLELIIHDGGSGLCAALDIVHFGAAQQRCLFHKLRNIATAILTTPELSASQQARQRRAILADFRAIWEPRQLSTALRRYRRVIRQYAASQPAAVAALRRDFRDTLTFFALETRHPHWARKHLRTTSWLERFNENLRARHNTARAYHSDRGILAMTAQVADHFNPGHLVQNGT